MAHSCPSDWTDHTPTTACAKHPGISAVATPYLTTTILAVVWQRAFFSAVQERGDILLRSCARSAKSAGCFSSMPFCTTAPPDDQYKRRNK